jgi:hypothetical protein
MTVMTVELADDVGTLLARGTYALEVRGDLQTSRQRFAEAFQAAEDLGRTEALPAAALGLGGLWVHEHRTATGSALLQARLRRALEAVDPASPMGVRLRVRLAGEIDYRNGEHGNVLAVLDEARALGDPSTTVEALSIAHHCLLGPGHGVVRRALAEELIAQGLRTHRRVDALMGALWQTVDLFLDGDPHAERRLRDLQGVLAEGDHLAVGYVVDAMDVMLNIRAGNLDEAESMAQVCAKRGATAGDIDAVGWHAAQLVAIRWYQGRIGELVPALRELVHSPTLSAVDNSMFAALAVAAASAGDHRLATGALATLCGRDLASVPRSSSWLAMMNGIVEAAHLLSDADIAAQAYELLVPYAELPIVASLGVACFGSVQHALGVASLTMGDVERAAGHLNAAIRHNLALGHWPAVVVSRTRYAQALRARGLPTDAAEARKQQTLAAAEADAINMPMLRNGADEAAQRIATCSRQGQTWRIDWDHRSVYIGHSVGMLHLAVLLNNPGKEIHSADLVTSLDLVSSAKGARTSAQPMLDHTAIRQYRQRLSQLTTEIDELESMNDQERVARARIEYDWLVDQLSAAIGISGMARNFPDTGERARIAVGKAIRRALTRIEVADPDLADHLRRTIRTGIRCSYRP